MGLRFHRSLKLSKLLRLNISKSGPSLSIGQKGSMLNVGGKGARTTIGLPGSGLSYSKQISYKKMKAANQNQNPAGNSSLKIIIIMLIVICFILAFQQF